MVLAKCRGKQQGINTGQNETELQLALGNAKMAQAGVSQPVGQDALGVK